LLDAHRGTSRRPQQRNFSYPQYHAPRQYRPMWRIARYRPCEFDVPGRPLRQRRPWPHGTFLRIWLALGERCGRLRLQPAGGRGAAQYAAGSDGALGWPARWEVAPQAARPAKAVIARLPDTALATAEFCRWPPDSCGHPQHLATMENSDTRTERQACRRRDEAAHGRDAILGT